MFFLITTYKLKARKVFLPYYVGYKCNYIYNPLYYSHLNKLSFCYTR